MTLAAILLALAAAVAALIALADTHFARQDRRDAPADNAFIRLLQQMNAENIGVEE